MMTTSILKLGRKALSWIVANRKTLSKALYGLAVGVLLFFGTTLYKENKKLSESLEMALNNIEAYQGSLNESWLANNVLRVDMDLLRNLNDKLLLLLDSTRKELKIKPKQIRTAATLRQFLYVTLSKGVRGDIIETLKDTIYTDSIKYNPLTTVYYTISKDTVDITLDLLNTQYLYVYSIREYKNKKNFFQRLFTLDFKKVNKYKYNIVNTNDLLKTDDVRVVESIK